ncbi:unnamed protein product, partial [Didymodactylos carnosus]
RIYVNHHRQELFKLNRYIILSLLDATKFLARQSLSFRAEIESEGNFNQMVSLLRRHNNTVDKWYNDTSTRSYQVTYLSNDAQNEFISILGKAVHDSIINRLNKSLFWSTVVDSTPDISHKDMMSIIVRFVDEDGEAEKRLLYIIKIETKTGKNIGDNMLQIFAKLDLDTNKLTGQSYDGAMNMSGAFKGVQTIISESTGREIIFVPCCAHRSNKIVEPSTQNSLEATKFFDLCNKIYVFITGSTKCWAVLRDIYSNSMNDDTLSLKKSTDTRWSSHYNSIIAIYESFTGIIQVLDELCDDNDKTTKFEANAIHENLDILLAIDTLTKTICLLNKIRNDEDSINNLLELAKERMINYDVDADVEFDDFRIEDAEQIKIIVPGINSSDLLYYNVQLLKENLQECSSIKNIMSLFLKNNYKCLYPRLYRVYTFILTLPVTVASNERTSSRLKLIKNHLRSKIFDDRLMNLLLCSSEKDVLDSLNLDELVTVWRTKAKRRLSI